MGIYIMIGMGVFLVFFVIWKIFFDKPENGEIKEALLEKGEIAGKYENLLYQGADKNDWHYVTIEQQDDQTYIWRNRAGVSWTLTQCPDRITTFTVG